MAFTSMTSPITPLSNAWTHEDIASQAMVLTNTLDNEIVQLDNIRHHINSSISHLANLLNLASSPWYGIWLKGPHDGLHATGLLYIDLSQAVNGFVPASQLHSLKRLSCLPNGTASTNYSGNCQKLDLAQLAQLGTFQNNQYRFTVSWCHNGSDLLLFAGSGIASPMNITTTATDYILTGEFVAIGYRKPILDDLLAPAVSANYRTPIDLPDEYVELLVQLVNKKILTQMREQVPAQLEQEINAGVAQITQLITADAQFEQAEREKRKYGAQQKAPGAVG